MPPLLLFVVLAASPLADVRAAQLAVLGPDGTLEVKPSLDDGVPSGYVVSASGVGRAAEAGTAGRGRLMRSEKLSVAGGAASLAEQPTASPTATSAPVNCEWASWDNWSRCPSDCQGTRFRRRSVSVQARNGGIPCNRTDAEQREACGATACNPNCTWSVWSSWSPCSRTCGNGTQTRSREPQNNMTNCFGSPREYKLCSADVRCPVDCRYSDWTAWSACSKTCGQGSEERSRTVLSQPVAGGAPCTNYLKDTKTCEAKCKVDCSWQDWTSWGACSRTCGGGSQIRTRNTRTTAQWGGKPCQGEAEQNVTCNPRKCPSDCVWGDWSAWTSCSATCGSAERMRRRVPAVPAVGGGAECSGSNRETEKCAVQACPTPVNCVWGDWSPWSRCSASCGGGSSSRWRTEKTKAALGGLPCLGPSQEQQGCNSQACAVNCKWTDWSPWSGCSKSCNGGQQERMRFISIQASNGGLNCTGGASAKQACNTMSCTASAAAAKPDLPLAKNEEAPQPLAPGPAVQPRYSLGQAATGKAPACPPGTRPAMPKTAAQRELARTEVSKTKLYVAVLGGRLVGDLWLWNDGTVAASIQEVNDGGTRVPNEPLCMNMVGGLQICGRMATIAPTLCETAPVIVKATYNAGGLKSVTTAPGVTSATTATTATTATKLGPEGAKAAAVDRTASTKRNATTLPQAVKLANVKPVNRTGGSWAASVSRNRSRSIWASNRTASTKLNATTLPQGTKVTKMTPVNKTNGAGIRFPSFSGNRSNSIRPSNRTARTKRTKRTAANASSASSRDGNRTALHQDGRSVVKSAGGGSTTTLPTKSASIRSGGALGLSLALLVIAPAVGLSASSIA